MKMFIITFEYRNWYSINISWGIDAVITLWSCLVFFFLYPTLLAVNSNPLKTVTSCLLHVFELSWTVSQGNWTHLEESLMAFFQIREFMTPAISSCHSNWEGREKCHPYQPERWAAIQASLILEVNNTIINIISSKQRFGYEVIKCSCWCGVW